MIKPEADKELESGVADFLRRAETKLTEASSGFFFRTNNARLLPSFDRGSDDDADEESSKEGTEHFNRRYEFGV
jgi:hypothetical protein